MRVKCTANSGNALTKQYLDVGYTLESVFKITQGREYQVFAVGIYGGATLILLSDDDDLPNWYPINLFSVADDRVPRDWHIAYFPGGGNALQLIIGYERLVLDEAHYDNLLERSSVDLEIFRLEKSKLKFGDGQ
jgi:hypothetical protein